VSESDITLGYNTIQFGRKALMLPAESKFRLLFTEIYVKGTTTENQHGIVTML
jgi:hypothetical protein